METPDDWVPRLAGHCRQHGLAFLSSPFDEDRLICSTLGPAFKWRRTR